MSFRVACDEESSFLFIIGRCHDYLNRGIVVMPGLIRYPLLFPLSRHSRGACDEESPFHIQCHCERSDVELLSCRAWSGIHYSLTLFNTISFHPVIGGIQGGLKFNILQSAFLVLKSIVSMNSKLILEYWTRINDLWFPVSILPYSFLLM